MFSFFVDHFNAVKLLNLVLFKNLPSLLSVSEFGFRCCASFLSLMAVICSPSCIVLVLALHRVCMKCLLTKNGTHNLSFLDLEMVLLSSDSNCRMRAAKFHQMSLTYHLGQCHHFQFFHGFVKLLIMNLKRIQIIFTSGNTFGSGITQFFIGN